MAGVDSWRTCLNNQKFVKNLAENNSKDSKQKLRNLAKSLFVVYDSDLYVWDSYACHIVYFNLKQLLLEDKEKQERFQTLLCTDAPRFDVECLIFNRTGNYLAVWGQTGITVIELPRRWGKYNDYEGGKQCVQCKSLNVAEHYFAGHNGVRLLTVLWHPGSETDSHIAFLTSDNTLSIYNIQEPNIPVQVIKLSNAPQDINQSPTKVSFPAVLGEYAASFDFGPPVTLKKKQRPYTKTETASVTVWPAYIVRGNGDVLVAYTEVSRGTKFPLQGPLIMQPPAEDNYGVDACAISCLETTPTALIIATGEGRLHHCLLIPAQDIEDMTLQSEASFAESSITNSTKYDHPSEASIFVFESVELELSLATGRVDPYEPVEEDFTCPIKIIKDALAPDRYHCLHAAGVHTVALPWIEEYYQQYFLSEEDADVPENLECTVEHLVCTKPLPSSPPAPVIGLAVVKEWQKGSALLTLTSDIEFISFPLRSRMVTYTTSSLQTPTGTIRSPLRKLPREPFDQYIAKVLQKNFTNPLLKSGKKTEMTQQECYQLLGRTTQVFREEYLQKQDLAQQAIQKRVRILTNLKETQSNDLDYLSQLKADMHDRAGELGVKCDECQDKNDEILKRIESIMRKLQARLPVLSEAERTMKRELETMHDKLESYKTNLQQLEIKQKYQKRQIDNQKNNSVSSPVLKDTQLKQIKDTMRKEGDELNELMRRVNQMKMESGV
ncbi:nucleoporin 88-like isoform X2 [Mytilus edulis]|uniref:nucleoporin 88-like isoform X2 n=1 Tax=Mytilus edulis TaxID=6550 RepID=UPI0039F10FE0